MLQVRECVVGDWRLAGSMGDASRETLNKFRAFPQRLKPH